MAGWMCVDGWMKFGGVCGIYLTVKGGCKASALGPIQSLSFILFLFSASKRKRS